VNGEQKKKVHAVDAGPRIKMGKYQQNSTMGAKATNGQRSELRKKGIWCREKMSREVVVVVNEKKEKGAQATSRNN